MTTVTTEQAMENAIASAEIEGFSFDNNDIELCRKYADYEISYDEFINVILDDCNRV